MYSPLVVSASEIITCLEKKKSPQTSSIIFDSIYLLWRILEGICRFSCFCACLGELLNASLKYLFLIVLYFHLTMILWSMDQCSL